MLQRIRWRTALPIALLLWFASLLTAVNLQRSVRNFQIDLLQKSSRQQLELLRSVYQDLPDDALSDSQLQVLTDQWAQQLGSGLSLISKDGFLLASSGDKPPDSGNQLIKKEIREADQDGFGSTIRNENQAGEFLIAAVPVDHPDQKIAYLRQYISLETVNSSAARLRNSILLFGGILSLLAVVAFLIISSRVITPLERLAESIHEIAAGNRENLPLIQGQVQISILTRSINRLSRTFRARIQELQSESGTLRAVLDQMTDGVVMVNPRGEISLINPAAEEIFHTTADQSVGRSVAEVLRRHQWIELWHSTRKTGQGQSASLELPAQQTFLQGIAIPLKDTLPGFTLLLFQDLSQIRRLETTRQDFISNISHELRTPLASLKALTETLQDGALEDPPAAKLFLSRIDTEVDALAQMVAELLELSRIESGQVPLDLDPVSPLFLLNQARDRMKEQAERRSLEVIVDAPETLPRVAADFRRVEQVVVNLLHNALKFSPLNEKIIMKASSQGNTVVFSVSDHGPGIPESDLERIFERFYKADQARTGGGTGLGLSIAKHLIEAHQGKIWAESTLNQGSTFYFSLPAAGQESPPSAAA